MHLVLIVAGIWWYVKLESLLAITICFSSIPQNYLDLFEYSSCFLSSAGAQKLITFQSSEES